MRFLKNAASWAWSWTKDHWRNLASLAVSAAVFTAVVWLMPVAAPALLTMAVAGFVSGAVGAIVSDLLDRHVPTVKHVLLAAVISTVLSVGSFGAAKWLGPYVAKLWEPIEKPIAWVLRPAISAVTRPGVTVVTNAVANAAEPLIVGAVRTFEASAGAAGNELARSYRDKSSARANMARDPQREPRAPPGSQPEAEPRVVPSPDPDAPDQNGTAPASPSTTNGLLGSLSKTSR